ncbi:hypothetical protein STEG23_025566 [Scotinomys teguina]
MGPRLQPSHKFQPRSWASVWALVATWATKFNTDPPQLQLGHGLRQEFSLVDILAPSGSPDHSDQEGSGSRTAPGHQKATGCSSDPRLCVAPWNTDINIDLGCGRIPGLDMVLSSNLGLIVTMAPGGSKGRYNSRLSKAVATKILHVIRTTSNSRVLYLEETEIQSMAMDLPKSETMRERFLDIHTSSNQEYIEN